MGRARLRANIIFNIVGMSLPIAVAFVTVPLYLAHIGAARYGLMSIIWVLLTYFAFADFGLARAATHALARLGDAAPVERHRVLMTAFYTNALFGLLAGLTALFGCHILIDQVLSLSADLRAEADAVIPWIAGLVPLTLIGAIARAAIESRERFLVVNLLELLWIIPGQVLPLLAAIWIGPELPVLLPPVFAARAVAVALALVIVARS
jgi:O-antigen/teichoic acid export membrane protein